ncbi:MAG: hypothetical protein M1830_004952, partial [Pleopsidium flavum]
AAAKRTAFGEVTNTANNARPSKDDSVIAGKAGYEITEKAILLQENKKPAALLRPAQRPLSVSGLKGLLTNATNGNHASLPVKSSVDGILLAPQPANTRKVLTKRNTTIFKDPVSLTGSQPEINHHQEIRTRASTASLHHPVASQIEQQQLVEPTESKLPDPLEKSAADFTAPKVGIEQGSDVSEPADEDVAGRFDGAYINNADGYVHFYQYSDELVEEQRYDDNGVQLAREAKNLPGDDIGTQERGEHLEGDPSTKVALQDVPPVVSEPEEYWDDEEDEKYDEEGYITARSYRSRGDNTTGGATTVLFPKMNQQVKKELVAATQLVEGSRTVDEIEDESWDTSMVAEYGDEIFQYMRELEVKMLPNAHYMDNQAEIQWSMRSVLMDWLVQVHHRFGCLPETLFLCVNYIDRFLSCKVVSLGKLQLVGATALFIAAKYEEINCPSVQEIMYMVDNGYNVDEILKAERFMLTMLQFELGWPGPMSFLRRISKADDYDLETRTLAKYFLEITIMDERFVGSPPSFVAAGAHCLARMMLRKGNWSSAHVYYSNYTYSQLHGLVLMIIECCESPEKHHAAIFDKYCDKRYKRASMFVATELKRGFRPIEVATNSAATMSALSETCQNWGRKQQLN